VFARGIDCQGFPYHGNILGEVAFLHEGIGPQRCHEMFLGQNLAWALHQQNKKIETLACQGYWPFPMDQLPRYAVQAELTELVNQPIFQWHSVLKNL
jgi:hypothetical protein